MMLLRPEVTLARGMPFASVSNFWGAMSVPMDLPYCLVYPTSYVRDVVLDHFDTRNNPAGIRLYRCVSHATLQFTSDDPKQFKEYSGSRLILSRGAQYNDRLFPVILEPWNHQELLIDSATKKPYPMELVGDFWMADPIFKGCYGDSLLYSDVELHWLRRQGIHLPAYQGEIPVPLAPSYQQAREHKVSKQSPPWVAAPYTPTESPKAKRSSGKSGPHRSLGCSSNTSTPKCPDSTSAKKSSNSKGPTSNSQEKSPKARSSHKHGCSPSPATESVGCKWKDVHMEDSSTLNTTCPISSSMFDSLCSPTGCYSDVTEPLPPSITSTPLGLAGLRHWRTTSTENRQSMASLYTSLNFNFPGYPAVGPSNLTPSIPSIAGSHHMLSTWPPGLFTPRSLTPRLTIDQANNIFDLAAECQVLGVKLAKEFQVLSGLEAMHCNSIQGMAHETLTLGCSAREAGYSAILCDGISEAECKAMTRCLHSEADAAWKEMHEVMYNHQLDYNQQLSAFLKETETTLKNMRDQVWAIICTLAENEGITFNDCLGLTLQVLNLLPQIPVDVSFQTQIPLTITYCPESSVYRRWRPEQGVSPLHKEVRASHTLSKVLGGVTRQPNEGVDHPPSPAASDSSLGSGGLRGSRDQSHSCAHSIASASSWRSDSVDSAASHHSVRSHATEGGQISSSESELAPNKEDATNEDENAMADKGETETSSDGQAASNDEEGQECPQT